MCMDYGEEVCVEGGSGGKEGGGNDPHPLR